MVSLLDKFMLTFVEEAESSTDMINHPSQHGKTNFVSDDAAGESDSHKRSIKIIASDLYTYGASRKQF